MKIPPHLVGGTSGRSGTKSQQERCGRRHAGLDAPFPLTAYDGFVTGGRSIAVATEVLAAVLGAALLHALWTSLVKSAGDKFLTSARVCLWCGVIALAVGCVLPTPDFAAAGFIVASAIIHVASFVLV